MGPFPMLAVTQPEHVEVILSNGKFLSKSFMYKFLRTWIGTGLLTSTGSKWHSRRKMLTPTFHFKILDNFIEMFVNKSKIFVNILEKEIGKESFNIYPYVTICTLDILCETAMGIRGNLQQQRDSKYANAVIETTNEVMTRVMSPWLYPNFIYNLTPSSKRLNRHITTMNNFINEVIDERKQLYKLEKSKKAFEEDDFHTGRKKKFTFLDMLLTYSENEKMSDEDIREEVNTFMFAGHDTTTAAISWTIQMLASHPEIQQNVYEELESIFEKSDRPPTMKDLHEMKYLERVIKETLRLYPSVPIIGRGLGQDVVIDNFKIPAGMGVAIFIYYIHRNPEYYPEPEKFNPDNFLPERIAARHPYAYIPFSAGSRNCIGQKFAMLEIKTVISYFLRHYRVDTTNEIPTALLDLILRPENGINIKITPRFCAS